jgi:integrase
MAESRALLTDRAIKEATPVAEDGSPKERRLHDRNGLYLTVSLGGKKWWRLKFHYAGKERRMGLGTYPEVSLKEARHLRDEARAQLRKGLNPQVQRKLERAQAIARHENSFELVSRKFITDSQSTWSDDYAKKFLRSLERDVFPSLGSRPIAEISPQELLSCLRDIEKRNAVDMAKRVCQRCSMVFKHAIRSHLCIYNPASELPPALKKRKVRHYAALDVAELHEFLAKLEKYDGEPITKYATKLLLLTFVRTTELREACWKEIDLDLKEWRIPASRMKMGTEHLVPLSKQAVMVFRQLQQLSPKDCDLVFPQTSDSKKPMSENTILFALYRMGYHSRATGHGFRTMASTALNEASFNADAVESQLAHLGRNQVRRTYNGAVYLPERRLMMQAWADFLDQTNDLPAATIKLRKSARKARTL